MVSLEFMKIHSHRSSVSVGGDSDAQLIDAKWESIALAPVGDSAFPHDYFLFTAVSYDPRS